MLLALTKKLTAAVGQLLDRSGPGPDAAGVGERVAFNEDYEVMAIETVLDNDYHTNAKSFTVPFKCKIIGLLGRSRATVGSATATLRRDTTSISGAVNIATDTLTVFGGLVEAQLSVAAGETLNYITNGANDRGVMTLLVVRA